jgi:two-component system chemotaxis response regulator CheB
MTGRRLRVLVVDDSPVQREILIGLLEKDPQIAVAGWSANGADALRAVERLQPDVITLDESMPLMGGLETARLIMRDWPTPIVMISADAHRLTDEALAAGIVAVQDKRTLSLAKPTELVRLVKSMAMVRLVRRRREPSPADGLGIDASPAVKLPTTPEIVAIGASTGGPQALREVLSRLPANFPLPILVVQHTTAGYSSNLVDWLQVGTRLPVRVAEDGEPLDRGGVCIAPTQRHLVVQGRHMTLLDGPPVSLHRPSATVLFRSVAAAYGGRAVGVLLTGMGDDGAAGLIDMKRAGALTMAQDEATCVVFGMPAEAIRLGAVDHILPPNQMTALLLEHTAAKEATR